MRTDSTGTYGTERTKRAIKLDWSVSAYLGTQHLGDVPVLSGSITDDETAASRNQLQLTVPMLPELLPIGCQAPLGNNGQTLRITKTLNGSTVDLGEFLITYARPDGGVIDVSADGPLIRLDMAKLTADVNYDGTFVGAIQLLCQNVVDVTITGLTDRALPDSVLWSRGDSRLDRFHEILTAWPADIMINDQVITIRPPFDDDNPGDPVETYVDGQAAASEGIPATLLDLSPSGDTQEAYNAQIVATAPGEGLSGVQSGAYVTDGPTAWTGPYGHRPGFFASPLLRPQDLSAVAVAQLQKGQRRQGTLKLQIITDDRIQVGDVIRCVQASTLTDLVGRVITTNNGVTAADDPTELTISILSGTVNGQPVVRGGVVIGPAPDPSGVTSGTLTLAPVFVLTYYGPIDNQTVYSRVNIFQGRRPVGDPVWLKGGATYDAQTVPGTVTSMRVRLQRALQPDNPPPLAISLMDIRTDGGGNITGFGDVVAALDGPTLVSGAATEFALPVSWLTQLWADIGSGDKKALGLYSQTDETYMGVLGSQFQILADWEGHV